MYGPRKTPSPRKTLPYVTNTETGTRIDADLPLHPNTVSIIRVNQMLDAVLGLIDREVKLDRSTANGDVLQALAMALAIRSAMIEAPKTTTDRLSVDLLRTALAAMDEARTTTPPHGTA